MCERMEVWGTFGKAFKPTICLSRDAHVVSSGHGITLGTSPESPRAGPWDGGVVEPWGQPCRVSAQSPGRGVNAEGRSSPGRVELTALAKDLPAHSYPEASGSQGGPLPSKGLTVQSICLGGGSTPFGRCHSSPPILSPLPLASQKQLALGLKFPPQHVLSSSF